jgi:hypothetical protein
LDEIDGFFNTNPRAQYELINYLYKNKEKNSIDELFSDESKAAKELRNRRPIILVGENMFSRGMQAFRKGSLVFRLYKNHDVVYRKVSSIIHEESMDISNDIIAKICTGLKDHLGAILNFLDVIRKGGVSNRAEIERLLERTSIAQIEKDYIGIFRTLFDKSKRNRLFHNRSM